MPMAGRHSEARNGLALEIEFDQHHRLVSHDPAIVTWFDRHDLRRPVFDDAAVGILDVDFALCEIADVRVHAVLGADDRLHVARPPETGLIDHPLHARAASTADLQAHASDIPAFGARDVRDARRAPCQRAPGRPARPDGFARRGRLASRLLRSGLACRRLLRRLLLCHREGIVEDLADTIHPWTPGAFGPLPSESSGATVTCSCSTG